MTRREKLNCRLVFLVAVIAISAPMVNAEVLYVDDTNGNDANPGTDTEKHAIAIKVEVNHTTVQGIKFLGNPRPRTWGYSIFRMNKGLNDLVVTQCMFVGDEQAQPYSCPICANGQGLVVDHCIFYMCDIPAIFWDAEGGVSRGNAMRYCIVTDNKYDSGFGTASAIYGQAGPDVTFDEKKVIKTGMIQLQKALVTPEALSVVRPRGYLHVAGGTLGDELGAGLFKEAANTQEQTKNN